MAIKTVLFDLDDTLYDRAASFTRWASDFLTHIVGLTGDERTAALHWLDAQDADGYGSKLLALQRLIDRYSDLLPAGQTAQRLYDEFLESIALDPSAVRLLDRIEALGTPYGIVTNGTSRQHRKITQLGLDRCTDCLFVSDTFGAAKPAPSIFLAAAACLGVPPQDILFVGDHPINDILGAQRVEMGTAWLSRGKSWPQAEAEKRPDFTLEQLSDLLPLLA